MPTLIVEDGSGVANANTYVDVDYCNTYCKDLNYSSWAETANTAKAEAILRAMNFIESLNWKGYKAEQDNSLEWPRKEVEDRNGYYIDDDVIPINLKKAVAEAAYKELTPGTLQPDLDGASNIQTMKAGSLAITYFEGQVGSTQIFEVIQGLLKGLVLDWTKVIRT